MWASKRREEAADIEYSPNGTSGIQEYKSTSDALSGRKHGKRGRRVPNAKPLPRQSDRKCRYRIQLSARFHGGKCARPCVECTTRILCTRVAQPHSHRNPFARCNQGWQRGGIGSHGRRSRAQLGRSAKSGGSLPHRSPKFESQRVCPCGIDCFLSPDSLRMVRSSASLEAQVKDCVLTVTAVDSALAVRPRPACCSLGTAPKSP